MQHLNRSSVVESMKGAKWISCGLALGLVSASAVWSSCNKEPQPEGRTALEHAYECEEVLGPLPRFSCEDAVPVPVTKNGIPLTAEQAGDGETNDPSLCDFPAAFGKACDPGFRVGRYTGLNQDGTPNEDVVFLTNCRDGGLGVIGYKFSTGETCFSAHQPNETTGCLMIWTSRGLVRTTTTTGGNGPMWWRTTTARTATWPVPSCIHPPSIS